ncbi:hypothetical protein QOT17_021300 [Balamuthia mandrillaris]
MPNVEDGLNCRHGSKFQSKFDLACSYWHFLMEDRTANMCAFVKKSGQFEPMPTRRHVNARHPISWRSWSSAPPGRTSFMRDSAGKSYDPTMSFRLFLASSANTPRQSTPKETAWLKDTTAPLRSSYENSWMAGNKPGARTGTKICSLQTIKVRNTAGPETDKVVNLNCIKRFIPHDDED